MNEDTLAVLSEAFVRHTLLEFHELSEQLDDHTAMCVQLCASRAISKFCFLASRKGFDNVLAFDRLAVPLLRYADELATNMHNESQDRIRQRAIDVGAEVRRIAHEALQGNGNA